MAPRQDRSEGQSAAVLGSPCAKNTHKALLLLSVRLQLGEALGTLVSFGFLYCFEVGDLKHCDFKKQIRCNIAKLVKSYLCSKRALFCF